MTVSATYRAADVILVDREGRILLFLRDAIDSIPWPGCWDLLGGIVEDGETLEEAARREVAEECGYEVAELQRFGTYLMPGQNGATCESHVFVSRIDAPLEELRLSPTEGQELRFFEPEAISELQVVWDGRILRDFFDSPHYRELTQNGNGANTTPTAEAAVSVEEPRSAVLAHDSAVIERMRRAAEQGVPWHRAVLDAIAEWRSTEETLADGRHYQYLIGGEAFDWLLLADRLSEELEGCIPDAAREALLFHGVLPEELSEHEFRAMIGTEKYRAHLNHVYGVRVEEALLLAVEQEIDKEQRSGGWRTRADDSAYHRIYSKGRDELLQMFREETGCPDSGEHASLARLQEFTYWLFKFRLRRGEPARIASDTRKGIAQLTRLQLLRSSSPSLYVTPDTNGTFIDLRARLR